VTVESLDLRIAQTLVGNGADGFEGLYLVAHPERNHGARSDVLHKRLGEHHDRGDQRYDKHQAKTRSDMPCVPVP
jgi:hypothetical protein